MGFFLERQDKKGLAPIRMAAGTVSIGRHPDNTVVLPAEDRSVSGYHALIYVDMERLLLQDLQSTNGTYVNGRQVQERVVKVGDVIGLGQRGPRFKVVAGEPTGIGFDDDSDIDIQAAAAPPSPSTRESIDRQPIVDTVGMIRSARRILTAKNIIIAAVALSAALIFSVSLAFRKPPRPPSSERQKNFFSARGELLSGDTSGIDPSSNTSGSAYAPRSSVEEKINSVLHRFDELDYSAPKEMIERVEFYLSRYSGPMKRTIASYMERRKIYFPMIRRVFTEKNIPLDLAYVSILESGLDPLATSHAGAKGLWQFMPRTARAYGLEVSAQRDERTDPEKATYAAAAYFKDLIAIFGAKSSVMLCMAAYNAGEHRVMNALRRIEDPVNDRDFWYLYKMGWLPEETREYIPQVIALIIISENPEEYGFER